MSILPSVIYLALSCFGIGSLVAKGKFGITDLIANVGVWALLYWGGFFDPLLRGLV